MIPWIEEPYGLQKLFNFSLIVFKSLVKVSIHGKIVLKKYEG